MLLASTAAGQRLRWYPQHISARSKHGTPRCFCCFCRKLSADEVGFWRKPWLGAGSANERTAMHPVFLRSELLLEIALVLRFIRTIHRSIALLLFPAKERSENLADAQIHRPRASGDPGASDWPPAPVAHHLFLLFYQVEIRHRQLRQWQSRTRSGCRCPHRYSNIMAIRRLSTPQTGSVGAPGSSDEG